MEKSPKIAQDYRKRALQEIQEARSHLDNHYWESAVSTAYYSCFYAVHSQLAKMGIEASSHKQVGIEFRRHFIKNKKLPVKFSTIWQRLSEERMEADYLPAPSLNREETFELVKLAEEFVTQVLGIEVDSLHSEQAQ